MNFTFVQRVQDSIYGSPLPYFIFITPYKVIKLRENDWTQLIAKQGFQYRSHQVQYKT